MMRVGGRCWGQERARESGGREGGGSHSTSSTSAASAGCRAAAAASWSTHACSLPPAPRSEAPAAGGARRREHAGKCAREHSLLAHVRGRRAGTAS